MFIHVFGIVIRELEYYVDDFGIVIRRRRNGGGGQGG